MAVLYIIVRWVRRNTEINLFIYPFMVFLLNETTHFTSICVNVDYFTFDVCAYILENTHGTFLHSLKLLNVYRNFCTHISNILPHQLYSTIILRLCVTILIIIT